MKKIIRNILIAIVAFILIAPAAYYVYLVAYVHYDDYTYDRRSYVENFRAYRGDFNAIADVIYSSSVRQVGDSTEGYFIYHDEENEVGLKELHSHDILPLSDKEREHLESACKSYEKLRYIYVKDDGMYFCMADYEDTFYVVLTSDGSKPTKSPYYGSDYDLYIKDLGGGWYSVTAT